MSRSVLKIAFQMDPMASINPKSDSSYILMCEAQTRGYETYHYLPTDLTLDNDRLTAPLRRVTCKTDPTDFYALDDAQDTDLTEMDIIFLRQDPPFGMRYISTTYMLDKIKDRVLVTNDPTSVRSCSEKMWAATNFSRFMAPTLVTSNPQNIKEFANQHGDIILKPLYGNAGSHIIQTGSKDRNLGAILSMFQSLSDEPIMAQKYLPAIREGDKRILLFDGEFVGAINRVPSNTENRAALALGAEALKTELTPREEEICETLKPELKARGLFLVGIDTIGDYLTEINTVSATGLQQFNRLNNANLEQIFWDKLEKTYDQFRSK